MTQDPPSQFAPSWFSSLEAGDSVQNHQNHVRAYVRLWRAFMRARVVIALVLLALQVFLMLSPGSGPRWLVAVCALHLSATLAVLFWTRAPAPGQPFRVQWLLTIGVDLITFGVLEHFQRAMVDGKEAKLAQQVRRVEWTETAGELGALLLEARLVKELRPLHNRRLRRSEDVFTVVLSAAADGRAEVVALEDVPTGETAYGLHRTAAEARKALEALARGKSLCMQVLGLERSGPGGGSCFVLDIPGTASQG